MKKVLGIILVGLFLIIPSGPSLAQSVESFNLSASIPQATAVSFTVSSVVGTVFSPVSGTDLSFDPMEYKTGELNDNINIWLPDHFFAIDIAPAAGGVGGTNVTITYADDPNHPNAAYGMNGLGWKATATFMKTSGSGIDTTDDPLLAHGPKKLLKDVVGENILPAETAGGWLRIYLGIVALDPDADWPDPAGAEPFTNLDHSGSYEGTLTISATVEG